MNEQYFGAEGFQGPIESSAELSFVLVVTGLMPYLLSFVVDNLPWGFLSLKSTALPLSEPIITPPFLNNL